MHDHPNAPGYISRRCFLIRTGLVAVGSAFGAPLLGFGEALIDIPCLGPAAAPSRVPGMTYVRASEIGCALDCDLRTGRNKYTGGEATDDAPRINAAMAGCSATNPITLIIDGSALVSGLYLPAAGSWSIAGLGCGTGFYVKSGINNDGIHNGPPNAVTSNDPGPPPPPRGRNVSLANFTLNGNQGNGRNGVSTTGAPHGRNDVWFFGVNLMNLDCISIQNLVVVNSPAYQVRMSNVGNVTVSGSVFQGRGVNSDGLHFDGPANDLSISNCRFTTSDDSIALNCPEGYSGDISRVTVTGCTFNSLSLMRLYTASATARFRIHDVSVNNCTGTLTEAAFPVGFLAIGYTDAVASLSVSNCSLAAPVVFGVTEHFGTIHAKDVTFYPTATNWEKQPSRQCAFLRPPAYNGLNSWIGSRLILENCKVVRRNGTEFAAVIPEQSSVISSLEFDGFSEQEDGSMKPAEGLLDLDFGSVGQLILNSVDSRNIGAAVQFGGIANVGSVSGAGVLATHWPFPDSVMADGVPYISAQTGRPSIKVNGIVEAYSQ